MKRQAYQPILITDAPRSQQDQLHSRQVRYVVMMSIRMLCVVAGAVLVMVEAPLLWLWLPLCGVGMILLPWLAVLIANDRLPKEEHRVANRFRRREPVEPAAPALTAEERPQRIVDVDTET